MNEKTTTETVVVGRNAVSELLKSGGADKVIVQTRRGEQADNAVPAIIALAKKAGVPVAEVDKRKLDLLSGGIPHQGVAAYRKQVEYATVDDILEAAREKNEKPFIVICDDINDPHNLGAVIRTAECSGAHGIIIPKRNSSGVTMTVVKAAAGATEHMKIVRVANINGTIAELKKKQIWVYAAEAGGKPFYETDMTGAVAVVLGSEGDGVSKLVTQNCDFTVSIPMYGKINSLNVSAAAAVILTEIAKQRHK